jgi:hypothetical protein
LLVACLYACDRQLSELNVLDIDLNSLFAFLEQLLRPDLRTHHSGFSVLHHLLHKACLKLLSNGQLVSAMQFRVKFLNRTT